jgi:hypothetical protein
MQFALDILLCVWTGWPPLDIPIGHKAESRLGELVTVSAFFAARLADTPSRSTPRRGRHAAPG